MQTCQVPCNKSPEQESWQSEGLREAVRRRLGGTARSESPCWLITSRAAALGRLHWITCPFRKAVLDLVRRLADACAPLGRRCSNADGLQPPEKYEGAESWPASSAFFPLFFLLPVFLFGKYAFKLVSRSDVDQLFSLVLVAMNHKIDFYSVHWGDEPRAD